MLNDAITIDDTRAYGIYEHDGIALSLIAICRYSEHAQIICRDLAKQYPRNSYNALPLYKPWDVAKDRHHYTGNDWLGKYGGLE